MAADVASSVVNQETVSAKENPKELRYWYFKLNAEIFGVFVEGMVYTDPQQINMGNWVTTDILSVTKHGTILETKSGSWYKLIGGIDQIEARKAGYPDSLIRLFKKGFPENWETLLREYYNKLKSTNPLNASRWFDHKTALQKKRQSMGVNIDKNKRKSRASSVASPTVHIGSKENRMEVKMAADVVDETIRRSPRILQLESKKVPLNNMNLTNLPPATPNASILTKNSTVREQEPTPVRFVPLSEGRYANQMRSRSISAKPRSNREVKQLQTPEVQLVSLTPRRRSAASPALNTKGSTSRRSVQDATPTKRQTRSSSVTPTPTLTKRTAKEAIQPTPTKSRINRASSIAPMKTSRTTPRNSMSNENRTSEDDVVNVLDPSNIDKLTEVNNIRMPDLLDDEITFKAPSLMTADVGNQITRRSPRSNDIKASHFENNKSANCRILTDWSIRLVPEMAKKSGDIPPFLLAGKWVGNKTCDQDWVTTLIVKVIEGETEGDLSFFTVRNTEYRLEGKINIAAMVNTHVFSKDFIKIFAKGFPRDWKLHLEKAFNDREEVRKYFSRNPDVNTRTRAISIPNKLHLNETTSSSKGRTIVKSSTPAITMPTIAAEKSNQKFVKPQKRKMSFSSSEDDNEAVINTMRYISYNDDFSNHHTNRKRRKTGEDPDEQLMCRLQRRKASLFKEMKQIDRLMNDLLVKCCRKANNPVILQEEDVMQYRSQPKPKKKVHYYEMSDEESDLSTESSEEDDFDRSYAGGEDFSDGTEWEKTPVRRVRKVGTIKNRNEGRIKLPKKEDKRIIFQDDNNESDGNMLSDEDLVPRKSKKKTWNQSDFTRLKHAIKALRPKNEEDWERISKIMGPDFTVSDCKDMAVKRLKWSPIEKAKTEANKEVMMITARQGTQAYKIQADHESRKYMLGAGSQENDIFKEIQEEDDDEDDLIVDNVADFDPDDSILETLKTPRIAEQRKIRNGQRIPTEFNEEDTPKGMPRKSLAVTENDDERENHQRYLHQITSNRNQNLNVTKANATMKGEVSMVDRSRAVENITRKMDKIKKTIRNQTKPTRNDDIDEDDEDDECFI